MTPVEALKDAAARVLPTTATRPTPEQFAQAAISRLREAGYLIVYEGLLLEWQRATLEDDAA